MAGLGGSPAVARATVARMTGSRTVMTAVPVLRDLVRRQHGVVTRHQLRALHVDRDDVANHLAALRWQAVTPTTVVTYTGPLEPRTRLWASVLACPDAVAVGSWTALAAHGLRGWDRDGTHIVVPRGARFERVPGTIVHESRRFAPEDVVSVDGLPVHRVERCAIDAAAWQRSPRTAVGLLAAVVQQRLTTPERLHEQLDRVGKVRFAGLMRLSIADISGGADALSEIDFARLCRSGDLPEPVRQVRRTDSRGRTRFLDVEWQLDRGRRLVVEIDGVGHMATERWYDDLLRDAELGASPGTVSLRLPAMAVRAEPERVLAILRTHLRELSE